MKHFDKKEMRYFTLLVVLTQNANISDSQNKCRSAPREGRTGVYNKLLRKKRKKNKVFVAKVQLFDTTESKAFYSLIKLKL